MHIQNGQFHCMILTHVHHELHYKRTNIITHGEHEFGDHTVWFAYVDHGYPVNGVPTIGFKGELTVWTPEQLKVIEDAKNTADTHLYIEE